MRGRPRSVDRGTGRPGIQPRKSLSTGRRRRRSRRKATSGASPPQDATESRAVTDPVHARTHLAREPGEPVVARRGWRGGPHREVQGRTPMMDDHGQSDRPVVPAKFPNHAERSAAEGMEGRGLAKGNPSQQNAPRAQHRDGALSALERVREAAERDKTVRFTTLLHHVYNVEHLRAAYYALKRDAAPGIDGETWRHYGEALEENLADLSGRLKRRAYRAKAVKRTYIPKADGRQRPLGIPTLEDKIVQRTTVDVLNAIYETDFLGFSYGFRPGRNPHNALDALYAGLLTEQVNWVLDADIRGFFEAINHAWLVKFVEHRIADQRVVRLIQKWLNAGVLENGARTRGEEGKPETFNFLGFTHICGKKRNGRFTVVRQTIRKRAQAKLSEVKAELRRRLHDPIPVVGRWLGQVVGGHIRYYGVPMNGSAIGMFRFQVGWLWHRALARRSQ